MSRNFTFCVIVLSTLTLGSVGARGETTEEGCELVRTMLMCWGGSTLTRDPKYPHTASFAFRFAQAFGSVPVITQAINVNGSGHGMAVYRWHLDEQEYTGRVNNMFGGIPVDGVISMSYIAIGKPKP